MADQKRWFKVWTTLATDPAFIDSNLSDIGRWILLGSWVAEHGNNGMITASENAFRKRLRIDNGDDTKSVILRLPNIEFLDAQNVHPNDNKMITKVITKVKSEVPFEEGKKDNDKFTVIIKNWAKYQKDSTSYERLKRWRKKQNDNGVRGEENKRRTRGEELLTPTPSSSSPPTWGSPERLVELYNRLVPPEHPKVTRLTPARRKKARKYLAMFPEERFWTGVFSAIQFSSFLRGLRPANGHEGFKGDFDWLLTQGKDGTENAVKVEEGRYQDAEAR